MYTALSAFLLLAIDPAIWHSLYTNGPAKVILLGGINVMLLQLLKRYFPKLGGWWAFAMNISMAVAGMAVTPPDQFWTLQTLFAIIQAAGLSAGIHGSVTKLANTDAIQTPAVKNAAIAALIALLMVGGVTGCNEFERSTFQTLSASQALINGAEKTYEARTIPRTNAAYTAINQAKAAQTAAVQAMVTYETIKAAKGTQTALQAQQAIVVAALGELPAILKAIQGFVPLPAPVAAPVAPAKTSALSNPDDFYFAGS